MQDVNLILAFAAGLLGFLSPCIVPLIPGYLSFVSGVSLSEMEPRERSAHLGQVLAATTLFVLGFSAVFTAMGASASLLGGFIVDNRIWLGRIGGTIVVLLGLSVLGVVRVPGLSRERRVHLRKRPRGMLGAIPVGMAFGFAWTPCVGPVLAAILTLAATVQGAAGGAMLLFAYSLGLGVPFLLAAALLTTAIDAFAWIRKHGRAIETVSGAFLVVMGGAMALDLVFRLNVWILRVFPFRPAL